MEHKEIVRELIAAGISLQLREINYNEAVDLINKNLQEYSKLNNLALSAVGSSLPSKDEKLIGNMCLSYRHDFGLLPKLIQDDLKRDCKNWLIAYENNIK